MMNEKQSPYKNTIAESDIRSGRDTHIGDVVYNNNYIQGQTVSIPHLLTNHIPSNADHILGRETELATITTHLAKNRATVLVNGIGGIGKTSVAAKFMALYGKTYKHLAWLTVQSSLSEAFTSDMVLLNALHISDEVQSLIEAQQLTQAFQLVFHKLNCLESTLVVLDNANDLADLVEHKKLFDTAHCHFLLTSRALPQAWQVVKIEKLSTDEALALFRLHAPSVQASDKDLTALLECLDFHTLLIELVAKSAYASAIPFETLQQMIQDNFIHGQKLNIRKVNTGTHGDSLDDNAKRAKVEEYIWLIFKNIADISDHSKMLLKAMALLPTATTFTDDFLETHFKHFGLDEDIFELLDHSVERGWLESVRETEKPAYKMHPLIADVVVKQLEVTVTFAATYIQYIAELIDYDPQNPEHNLFDINKNKPLAERLNDLFFDENTEGVSELLDNLGYLEQNFGFYDKSAEFKARALEVAETIFEKNHATIAVRQSNLASVYSHLGHYEQAAQLFETVLKSTEKNFGIDHPTVSVSRSNLATVYINLGRYEQAAQLLETALQSAEKSFGNDHPTVVVLQSNLANVYRNLGRYEQAAQLLETALQSTEKNFGNDHPTVAVRQSNLANVYRNLGRYEQAAQLLETALQNDLKNFGNEHPNVAVSQSNLANVYSDLGRYEQAAQLLETALQCAEKNFGNDHPTVAVNQNNLAIVYYNVGRNAEAKTLWQAAYQNYLKNLGATHPHTIQLKEYAEM